MPEQDEHILEDGTVLDGKYVVQSKLGEGSMGAVYIAQQEPIRRPVAVKVLHPRFVSNEEVRSRFLREAQTASQLSHPNTVTIFDFGYAGENLHYIVMEYIEGETLEGLIDREGPLSLARTAPIIVQIAQSLGEAHRKSIIHRDLKPANVLIQDVGSDNERVKVLDFGIAKLTNRTQGLTEMGAVFGTPGYIAPEQAKGADVGKEVDHTCDFYALTCSLFEALMGRVPYRGNSPVEIMMKHQTEPIPRLAPEFPDTLDAFLRTGMAKEPVDRPQSADDYLAAFLGSFVEEAREGDSIINQSGSSSGAYQSYQSSGTAAGQPASALNDDDTESDSAALASTTGEEGEFQSSDPFEALEEVEVTSPRDSGEFGPVDAETPEGDSRIPVDADTQTYRESQQRNSSEQAPSSGESSDRAPASADQKPVDPDQEVPGSERSGQHPNPSPSNRPNVRAESGSSRDPQSSKERVDPQASDGGRAGQPSAQPSSPDEREPSTDTASPRRKLQQAEGPSSEPQMETSSSNNKEPSDNRSTSKHHDETASDPPPPESDSAADSAEREADSNDPSAESETAYDSDDASSEPGPARESSSSRPEAPSSRTGADGSTSGSMNKLAVGMAALALLIAGAVGLYTLTAGDETPDEPAVTQDETSQKPSDDQTDSPSESGGAAAGSESEATRELSVKSEPSGAEIELDGRSVGVTPSEIQIPTDRPFSLKIAKQGYEVKQYDGIEASDYPSGQELFPRLNRKTVQLTVRSPVSNAELKVNGDTYGSLPKQEDRSFRIEWPTSKLSVILDPPDYEPYVKRYPAASIQSEMRIAPSSSDLVATSASSDKTDDSSESTEGASNAAPDAGSGASSQNG